MDTTDMKPMRCTRRSLRVPVGWLVLLSIGIFILIVNLSSLTVPDMVGTKLSEEDYVYLRQVQGALVADSSKRQPLEETHPPMKEVQHVAFLKVHKAASSTAQNIFLRYGWYRNLTFVLSPAKNKFGYPNIISLRESLTNSNILSPPPNKTYDILCNHVFYTHDGFSSFMPKDTAYIGILREPFEQYKSTLNYFHPKYIFKKINGDYPASQYLRNPSQYEPNRLSSSWTNNRMALEFGFPEKLWKKYNETEVSSYLKRLDKEFTVILIADYLEESVILMRRRLGWTTKDVIYLDKNVARRKNETKLSRDFDRQFYKQYAKLDYALYEYFYKRLREQIRKEGEEFYSEFLHFKELRKNASEFCRQREKQVMRVEGTLWSEAFNITMEDCAEMRMGEIHFVQRIRLRQYGSITI